MVFIELAILLPSDLRTLRTYLFQILWLFTFYLQTKANVITYVPIYQNLRKNLLIPQECLKNSPHSLDLSGIWSHPAIRLYNPRKKEKQRPMNFFGAARKILSGVTRTGLLRYHPKISKVAKRH